MNELDMSRPGGELFPESSPMQHNSYTDVNMGHGVDDPLNTGVTQPDVAGQVQLSDKEMNFRALREETAKLKQESEYWRGQAEAYSRHPARNPEPEPSQSDVYSALDWTEGNDVRKAFEMLRNDNQKLKDEFKDQLAAVQVKSQHADWNNMVTQHVPQLTSKNPIFAEMIQNASNPYEAAYLLAQLNAKGSQPVQEPQQQQYQAPGYNAQRAMNNAQKPQSLASVGGQSTLSSADYYANMSDEDFHKIAARNMANI